MCVMYFVSANGAGVVLSLITIQSGGSVAGEGKWELPL